MSIIEFDGPPSWSLDASEIGESIKCPWVVAVELIEFFPTAVPSTAPTQGNVVLSPVSLASRDQDGGPSNSKIDTYDPTEK